MTEWKLFNWAHISGSSWTIDGYKLYYEKPWKDEWNMIIDSKLMIWNSGRLVDLYPTGVCVKFFMPTTIFDNTTAVVTIGRDIYECCLAFVYDTEDNDAIYINIWNEDPKATIDIQLSSGTLLNIPLFTTFEQEKSCNAQKHYERTMVLADVVKKLPKWENYECVGIAPRSGYWDGAFDIIICKDERFYRAIMIVERPYDQSRLRVVLEIPDSEMDSVENSNIHHSRYSPICQSERWAPLCGKRYGVTSWKEIAWILN